MNAAGRNHPAPRAAKASKLAGWRAAGIGLVAVLSLAGCGQPASDPEARIRALLAEVERAAQAGEFEVLADRVARDYADREGRDRRSLLFLVRSMLTRYPRLELVVTVREIEILSPRLARVRLDVITAGAGPAGLSADAFPVELSLRDDGGDWQLTRAEWGRGGGDDI